MKIFYGVCGEGRGHAGRSFALIERLQQEGFEVSVFTSKDGLDLFQKSGFPPALLHKISGLHFCHNLCGVDLWTSAAHFVPSYIRIEESQQYIDWLADQMKPGLFITDFEPATAFVAFNRSIPCVCIDNQHKFCTSLDRDFPLGCHLYGWVAGQFTKRWVKRPTKTLVCTFHKCGQPKIEIMVRDRMAAIDPTDGPHVMIYAKESVGIKVVNLVKNIKKKFIAYGFSGPTQDNVEYRPISYDQFAQDLASCHSLIGCAGNQLLGEAKFFGKKVLGIPLPYQTEQAINALYIKKEGIGDSCKLNELNEQRIRAFLDTEYARYEPINGVDQAMGQIYKILQENN